jgi:hypothetical protein
MERVLGVSKKAVLDEEFATFVDLDLSLHIGPEDLLPHFHRCIGEEEDAVHRRGGGPISTGA